MAKFKKVITCEGTLVFVPNDFYNKMRRKIKGNIAGVATTRMYLYFIGTDSIMWRHPVDMDWYTAKENGKLERVVSQCACYPEVLFV